LNRGKTKHSMYNFKITEYKDILIKQKEERKEHERKLLESKSEVKAAAAGEDDQLEVNGLEMVGLVQATPNNDGPETSGSSVEMTNGPGSQNSKSPSQRTQVTVKEVVITSPSKVNKVILDSAAVVKMLETLKHLTDTQKVISQNFVQGMQDLKSVSEQQNRSTVSILKTVESLRGLADRPRVDPAMSGAAGPKTQNVMASTALNPNGPPGLFDESGLDHLGDDYGERFESETRHTQDHAADSISKLCDAIRGNQNGGKVRVKRDYRLAKQTRMEVWLDNLRRELKAADLLDVIEFTPNRPVNLTPYEKKKREDQVRDIIISRIDEDYHRRVIDIEDPRFLLERLREIKKLESNITHTSVRAKLYDLRMKPKEKVSDFINKFEGVITEYENCASAVKLTEMEKRGAFERAVSGAYPELGQANAAFSVWSDEFNYQQMKDFLSKAEEKRQSATTPQAHVARGKTHDKSENKKCFRCEQYGHWKNECPSKGNDLWWCRSCKSMTSHKADNCHSRNQSDEFKTSSRGRGRGGRGTSTPSRGASNSGGGGDKLRQLDKKSFNVKKKKQENDKGMLLNLHFSKNKNEENEASFIADTGATEHIVNGKIKLWNFEKSTGEVIRCANKNEDANIEIDGRGDLILISPNNKNIRLTNVLSASGVSDNLISLRHFAEAGLSIYLDDNYLDIYDKVSGISILKGTYEKPNWVIRMSVKNRTTGNLDYDEYTCKANFASLDDFLDQSQNEILNLETQERVSKFENEDNSETGREIGEKFVETEKNSEVGRELGGNRAESENNSDCLDWELSESFLGNRVLNSADQEDLSKLEEMVNKRTEIKSSALVKPEVKRLDPGTLWHVRLGHPSLGYLNLLKKKEPRLENIKFGDTISDCETCILAKMKRLPFNEVRTRAERPLKLIHTDTMGSIKPLSYPGGNRFIITFIDDHSRFAKIYSVKNKSDSGMCLEKYLRITRNLVGKDEKVCFIRTDRGTEFTGGDFKY